MSIPHTDSKNRTNAFQLKTSLRNTCRARYQIPAIVVLSLSHVWKLTLFQKQQQVTAYYLKSNGHSSTQLKRRDHPCFNVLIVLACCC